VKIKQEGGSSRPWSTARFGAVNPTALIASVPVYALLFLILIPWIGLGAVLLADLNARERVALEEAAHTRASLAASSLDQQISALMRTLGSLRPASSTNHNDQPAPGMLDGAGIGLLARTGTLEVVSAAGAAIPAPTVLDSPARSAAAAALATKTPQVSAFRVGNGVAVSGLDLWLPSVKNGEEPVLLQAHIPTSFLSAALGSFASEDGWSISVSDPSGNVLTKVGDAQAETVAEVSSATSALGLHVRAATSLAPLEASNRRNWLRFLVVTSLLTAATLAFSDLLSRRLAKEGDGPPTKIRIPADGALMSRRSEEFSEAGMLMPAEFASHRHSPQRPSIAEERLRLALDAGGMCAWEWRRSDGSMHWDTSCTELVKRPRGMATLTARGLLRRVPPHDRNRLLHAVRATLAEDHPLAVDIRLKCFDGELRWFAVRATPLKEHKSIAGIVGIAYDVTDQKRSLSRTDSLLREVSHRSKNMLALILAMARLTAREAADVKSHLKDFALRVAGLAASQDLIVAADWQSVELSTLASAEIEAVARVDASRVTISGPPFLVTPEAAQTLGMILTELALNAVAHGALSVAAGEVHLSWILVDDTTIAISWHEIGGPAYDPERPKGYGMSVVERFSTQGLRLASHVTSDATGFTWTLTGPISNVGRPQLLLPA
jgi:two-component sensor histidine kinase